MIPISIHNLEEGWEVGTSIFSNDGKVVLVASGTILTSSLINKLKKRLLVMSPDKSDYFIDIVPNLNNSSKLEKLAKKEEDSRKKTLEQDSDISGILDNELKYETLQNIRNIYINSEKELNNNIELIKKCITTISHKIQMAPNFSYSLGQYKEPWATDGDEHSFRVAQFAIALANIYNQTAPSGKEISLESIGMSAILHDYGSKFEDEKEMKSLSTYSLNSSLVTKYNLPSDLLKQPYQSKYQTVYAYTALMQALPATICNTILLSGAKEDSKLFTNQTDQTAPSVMAARIISLCNMYDTLLERVIQNDMSLENVSSLMRQLSENRILNRDICNLFLKNIPLYSVGVRVLLSTGEYATVVERFQDSPTTPLVKTLVNKPNQPRLIDLRTSRNITISKIVSSSQSLSKKIKEITDEQLKTISITSFKDNKIIPFINNKDLPKAK